MFRVEAKLCKAEKPALIAGRDNHCGDRQLLFIEIGLASLCNGRATLGMRHSGGVIAGSIFNRILSGLTSGGDPPACPNPRAGRTGLISRLGFGVHT
jgi:hypothetical protein